MSRRARGEGTVVRDGNGWSALLRVDGRRVKRRFPTKDDAVHGLDAMRARRDSGRRFPRARYRVRDLLRDWLEAGRWRPATRAGYESKVRLYLEPALGGIELAKLTPQEAQRMLAGLERRGLSPRTVQQTRAILRSALTTAQRWDLVDRNVARLVAPPRAETSERPALSAGQVLAFLEAARRDRLEALYVLAVAVGLRQGEALGLRWEDVELEARELRVRKSLHRQGGAYVLLDPKTARSRRTIPLPLFVADALRRQTTRQKEERMKHGREDWRDPLGGLVFTTKDGSPLNGSVVTHRLHELTAASCASCGAVATGEHAGHEFASLPRVRFHDLRHCAATLMQTLRVQPRLAQALLGHSSVQLTLDVYSHAADDELRAAMDRLEAWRTPPAAGDGAAL